MVFRECDRCHERISMSYAAVRIEPGVDVLKEPTFSICSKAGAEANRCGLDRGW